MIFIKLIGTFIKLLVAIFFLFIKIIKIFILRPLFGCLRFLLPILEIISICRKLFILRVSLIYCTTIILFFDAIHIKINLFPNFSGGNLEKYLILMFLFSVFFNEIYYLKYKQPFSIVISMVSSWMTLSLLFIGVKTHNLLLNYLFEIF